MRDVTLVGLLMLVYCSISFVLVYQTLSAWL